MLKAKNKEASKHNPISVGGAYVCKANTPRQEAEVSTSQHDEEYALREKKNSFRIKLLMLKCFLFSSMEKLVLKDKEIRYLGLLRDCEKQRAIYPTLKITFPILAKYLITSSSVAVESP